MLTNIDALLADRHRRSATRFYYEDATRRAPEPSPPPCRSGWPIFAGDFQSIRPFAERDHKNIVHWHSYDQGGHYAAHIVPDVLVDDLRTFYGKLR